MRAEMSEDFLAIHHVNASAFERPNEAILVDALRRTAGTYLSLVAVVVLGHPTYYSRFGFVPAVTKGLRCEYPVPDEAFMVAEVVPEALDGRAGLVKYRPEFAAV